MCPPPFSTLIAKSPPHKILLPPTFYCNQLCCCCKMENCTVQRYGPMKQFWQAVGQWGILVGYFGSSILHPCTPHTHWMTPWKHSPGRAHQLNPKYTPHIHFVVLSYIWENVPLPTLVLKVLPLWASDSIEQNRRWQPATNVTASKKSGRQEVTHLRKGGSSTARGGTTAYCVVRHCWLAPIIYWLGSSGLVAARMMQM